MGYAPGHDTGPRPHRIDLRQNAGVTRGRHSRGYLPLVKGWSDQGCIEPEGVEKDVGLGTGIAAKTGIDLLVDPFLAKARQRLCHQPETSRGCLRRQVGE